MHLSQMLRALRNSQGCIATLAAVKRQPWTKEDIRTLKTLAREKKKTTTIARMLKRTVGATYQQASKLGVTLGSRG
jgi:hypothetical protein